MSPRPLGQTQLDVLDLLRHSPYPDHGWLWSTHSETVRICRSLVKRGLVVETITPCPTGVIGRTHSVFTIAPPKKSTRRRS